MNLHQRFLGSILVLATLVSCGKKPEIKNEATTKTTSPSEAEAQFTALKELRTALRENDVKTFRTVLKKNPGVDLNEQFRDTGETLLTIAIKRDHRDIRDILLENGAKPERANLNQETPLLVAVAENHLNSVIILCNLKVDLETRDSNRDTALHVALKKGHDRLALELLQRGADLKSLDGRRQEPLKLAERSNVPESLRFIRGRLDLEFGAPDLKRFREIVEKGDYQTLEVVVGRYPVVATEETYESINPLALLVKVPNESNALRSARILLANRANVDGPLGAEQSPLIKATVNKKQSFVKLYLSSRAKTELVDNDGRSALIHAIMQNNLDLVNLLLDYSAVEKYTFRRDGMKITFDACDVAKDVARAVMNEEDRQTNKKIRKSLGCGFLGGLF